MVCQRHSHEPLSSGIVFSLLLALASWFMAIRIVWNDWMVDPQYGYGIVVPFLSVGLLIKRWEDRPAPSGISSAGRLTGMLFLILGTFLLALAIPFAEANPDWRPLGLVASVAALFVTISVSFLLGGHAWLRHFLMPAAFILIAVPWPRNLEHSVMSALMSCNTSATMEILNWSGYEAVRQGNLIVLPTGILGIEEACSGIRSLQSGLMVALFFGEVYRLHPIRRAMLLFVALVAAFAGNVARSSMLALIASRKGIVAVSTWHDSAGVVVLLIEVGVVFACALRWKPGLHGRAADDDAGNIPSDTFRRPGFRDLWKPSPLLPMSALSILICSLTATEAWFMIHDLPPGAGWGWKIARQEGVMGVSDVPIPSRTLRMLFYPDGFSEKWTGSSGEVGQTFYLEWPQGRTALQSVQMHSPDVCLSNIGMHLERRIDDAEFVFREVGVRFHGWLFSQRGKPVYVFHSIMEQGSVACASMSRDQSLFGRFRNVLQGKRNRSHRMLEVAFWNLNSERDARAALGRYFQGALTVSPAASPSSN